jgi:hypothetical protein
MPSIYDPTVVAHLSSSTPSLSDQTWKAVQVKPTSCWDGRPIFCRSRLLLAGKITEPSFLVAPASLSPPPPGHACRLQPSRPLQPSRLERHPRPKLRCDYVRAAHKVGVVTERGVTIGHVVINVLAWELQTCELGDGVSSSSSFLYTTSL